MRIKLRHVLALCLMAGLLALACPVAAEKLSRSQGQTIYVPAYSHIYHGVKTREFLLTVTLSQWCSAS